jgi:hypothetical protein
VTPVALQERSCHLKRRYFTEVDALIMADRRAYRGAPRLRAYECQYCGGWHLTKKLDTQKQGA